MPFGKLSLLPHIDFIFTGESVVLSIEVDSFADKGLEVVVVVVVVVEVVGL